MIARIKDRRAPASDSKDRRPPAAHSENTGGYPQKHRRVPAAYQDQTPVPEKNTSTTEDHDHATPGVLSLLAELESRTRGRRPCGKAMTQFFTQVRTSRKLRQCERCLKPIGPGERYNRHSAPPGGELGNLGWWHIIEHPADGCPEAVPPR